MNLRDLRYLVAIDKYRHFGRAADACYVSQPTLSGQIKKLEDTLGVQLMERSNKRVIMTPIGEQIVARARLALAEAEAIERIAKSGGDPLAGELRIGVIPTLGPYLLGKLIPQIKQKMPLLRPMLIEDQTSRIVTKLRNGELDTLILATPVDDTDGLAQQAVFYEPFVLALPANHRLAERKRVSTADLVGENLLLLEEGHCLRQHALAFCQLGSADSDAFRATSLETLRQMVATGAGLSLFPALAVQQPIAEDNGLIAYRPFAPKGPGREISVLWRPETSREAAIECLMQVIRACGLERSWLL